jgi:phage gp16-like protein
MSRRALLAKVHIAKKELRLDDSVYQAMILAESDGQASSAADLTIPQLESLVERFIFRGWKPKTRLSPATTKTKGRKTPVDKLRALWINAAKLGGVRDRTEAGLRAWLKRQCGVERPEWLDQTQLNSAIEGLKKIIARKEAGHADETGTDPNAPGPDSASG